LASELTTIRNGSTERSSVAPMSIVAVKKSATFSRSVQSPTHESARRERTAATRRGAEMAVRRP
jgi:hypothetical protein